MSRPFGPWAFLNAEPGPRMILEALKEFGTVETPGLDNNPKIVAWADELGEKVGTAYARWAAKWYDQDSIPWCGLFMAVVAKRAGKTPPVKFLAAREWENWGNPVEHPGLGDVLVFTREGGGHVGLYVGEGQALYYVLGGNQGDTVSVIAKEKRLCTARRRPAYTNQPANVRPIFKAWDGPTNVSEA